MKDTYTRNHDTQKDNPLNQNKIYRKLYREENANVFKRSVTGKNGQE